jgi:hypothetical protein
LRFGFVCNDEKYDTLRAGPSLWGVTLPCIWGVFGKDGSGSNLNGQNSWANKALAVVVQFEVLRLNTRNRETGIYLQSTASCSREIAADSRETGINWSEIATYIQEIAADIQEIAVTLGKSASASAAPPAAAQSSESAAPSRGWKPPVSSSVIS